MATPTCVTRSGPATATGAVLPAVVVLDVEVVVVEFDTPVVLVLVLVLVLVVDDENVRALTVAE
jgi:hypothetical protein